MEILGRDFADFDNEEMYCCYVFTICFFYICASAFRRYIDILYLYIQLHIALFVFFHIIKRPILASPLHIVAKQHFRVFMLIANTSDEMKQV